MEVITPEKMGDLAIKSIELNAGQEIKFSVFFSYGDNPATAVITEVVYYKGCNGKLIGFAKTTETDVTNCFITIMASTKLEDKIMRLSDAFIDQFEVGEVMTDENKVHVNGDINKYIADAVDDDPCGWY